MIPCRRQALVKLERTAAVCPQRSEDIQDWTRFFEVYAESERRSYGRIDSGGGSFVLSNGRMFPLKDCILRPLRDGEWKQVGQRRELWWLDRTRRKDRPAK